MDLSTAVEAQWIDTDQAGELLAVSPKEVTSYIRLNVLKGEKRPSGIWRVDHQSVLDLAEYLQRGA